MGKKIREQLRSGSKHLLWSLFLLLLGGFQLQGQTIEKKVLLQGFWWNFDHGQYIPHWSNYLADLAPRLQEMGVDAIWIPPSIKNDFNPASVGYAPFDHYDLGDKYQKGQKETRMGNKDELLRMVAILHANGIEVIQDIVPNHIIGAGDLCGQGLDPAAQGDQYKNFRYVCFETPAENCNVDYLSRKGRFPKNWQNFHSNPGHNCSAGENDICQQLFGPDVCYKPGALGYSSNAVYNPNQSTYDPYGNGGPGGSGYMRKHFREWLIWYKKQTGFDGVRMDAVKHFPTDVAEDFLYNLQFGALWANGGTSMLAVGEWVGGAGALDGWTLGTQERAGTFDFALRGALFGMANGEGFYDMSQIPGSQQNSRTKNYGGTIVHRTVPFVNNHDTFRPCVDGSGNYTPVWGGDQCGNGNELAEHISPENWRMPLAYAVAFAVDGNPQVFFEDLFDLNNGNRYSHDPTSDSSLPANDWLVNLIWCHQNLDFKNGDYSIPTTESSTFFVNGTNQDLLIIERNNKAFIALNDTNTPRYAWIDTNWPVGTVLQDYSGQTDTTVIVTTPSGGTANRVLLKAPPVGNLSSGQHGFSIWAPVGAASNYLNPAIPTTQEWEMADDLGDSHCESLTQGGALPASSTAYRVAGKIFPRENSSVLYELYPEINGQKIVLEFYDLDGNLLHQDEGTNSFTGVFAVPATGWVVAKMRHADWTGAIACPSTNISAAPQKQKAYLKLTYDAPASVSTNSYPSASKVSFWTGAAEDGDWSNCRNWEEGMVPNADSKVIVPTGADVTISGIVTFEELEIQCGASVVTSCNTVINVKGDWVNEGVFSGGSISMIGTDNQVISGDNTFCILEVANGASVNLQGPVEVTSRLRLTDGILNTASQEVHVSNTATTSIQGASPSDYVVGNLRRSVADGQTYLYPLGDEVHAYNPATITFSSVGAANEVVGTFDAGISTSVPETLYCEVTGDNQDDGILYDCVVGGWQFSAPSDAGVAYTITVDPSVSLLNTCTNYLSLSKDGNYGCNAGLSASYASFSLFDIVGSTTASLPVSLRYFRGELQQGEAYLEWLTEWEEDAQSFIVERSLDGRQFSPIGEVDAVGSSTEPQTYAYVDVDFPGKAFYRLQQVDWDGAAGYSEAVYLIGDKTADRWAWQIVPNPGKGDFQIQFHPGLEPADAQVSIQLTALSGQLIGNWTGPLPQLNERLNAILEQQPEGVYQVAIRNQEQANSQLLIKQ